GLFPVKPPLVAGHEPTGEIVELGEGVTDLKVGDRVGVFWNQKGCGRCVACQAGVQCPNAESWMNLGGGNSELMLAWASGCQLIPDGLDLAAAAPSFCAGFTVMSALRDATPKPGERVAVLGVGGLGHLAVQLSKAIGLETLAITGQANKRAELLALGADDVLIAGDDPGKALREAGGADVVVSTTNSAKQISQVVAGLRPRGRLINTGVADGAITLDPLSTMLMRLEFRGSTPNARSDLAEVLALAARGKVKPQIEVDPLEQANEARERLESGKVRYRAVLQHA
ncbi:MAG: alcohol dehydrogenase, partial [Labilithrix sp.]|nr:alcohol dehydrogenase [Labilithrix sp.]